MLPNKKIKNNKILIWKSPATLETPQLTQVITTESAEKNPRPATLQPYIGEVATSEGSSSPAKASPSLFS